MISSCLVLFTVFFRALISLPGVLRLFGWPGTFFGGLFSALKTSTVSLRGMLLVLVKHVGADSISFAKWTTYKYQRF